MYICTLEVFYEIIISLNWNYGSELFRGLVVFYKTNVTKL